MSMEEELGTLIRVLNPYTNGAGTMKLAAGGAHATSQAVPQTNGLDLSHIELEVQSNYQNGNNYETQWTFKNQTHNVVRAMRIKYHYPVKGSNGKIWATDYLLVGFEGSGGP